MLGYLTGEGGDDQAKSYMTMKSESSKETGEKHSRQSDQYMQNIELRLRESGWEFWK